MLRLVRSRERQPNNPLIRLITVKVMTMADPD